MTIKGSAVELIGDYYIRVSAWDRSNSSTSSVSWGHWHKGSHGQYVLEKARGRESFPNSTDELKQGAIAKCREAIARLS